MKVYLTALLFFFKLFVISQTLPNNFKIGNYVEVFSNDSIKIYFNCTGTVTDKKCASYYRVGKMDSSIINVIGDFTDYYVNGQVCLKATMRNNNLEGLAHYYYENGKLKEEGNYKNNMRQGKWAFYYPNGNIEKVYEYTDSELLVLKANNYNGKATVTNKNGNFTTEWSVFGQCDKYEASGQIKNGKKNGEWKFFARPNASQPVAIETYEEGNFIKGYSNNYEYTENPKILITDFYPNENLAILENSIGCPGNTIMFWRYNNQDRYSSFYPKLQDELSKYNKLIQNQWLVVGIKISKKNKIEEINVASTIDDKNVESYVYSLISKMTEWQTTLINSNKVETNIFFSVLVDNNQIVVPIDYIHRNRGN